MKITPKAALAAIRAFQDAVEGDVVPQQEVVRRLEICSACPKRERTRGAGRISAFLGVLANKHRLPEALADQMCGVCGCSLMLIGPSVELPELKPEHPEGCWIRQQEI